MPKPLLKNLEQYVHNVDEIQRAEDDCNVTASMLCFTAQVSSAAGFARNMHGLSIGMTPSAAAARSRGEGMWRARWASLQVQMGTNTKRKSHRTSDFSQPRASAQVEVQEVEEQHDGHERRQRKGRDCADEDDSRAQLQQRAQEHAREAHQEAVHVCAASQCAMSGQRKNRGARRFRIALDCVFLRISVAQEA